MDVSLNGTPMWLCQACGWLWPLKTFTLPAQCAACRAPDCSWPREDGPELPGA